MTNDLIPLYGFVRGDTLGLLVLAREDDAIATVAAALMQAAQMRVKPAASLVLLKAGSPLDSRATVRDVGLRALDRVDLIPGSG